MTDRRTMDDPRLLVSRPFRAVHFVFGLSWPEVRPLPAAALVTSLGALGMSPVAARGTLLRLRRAGALASQPMGRRSSYALTPVSKRLIAEILRRATEDPPPWNGVFRAALVDVPSDARAYRDTFMRRARYAGFGILRPGLLVAPYETSWSAIEPTIARAGARDWITRADLKLSTTDARRVAREVWDLDALAGAVRRESRRMSTAVAAHDPKRHAGATALAASWRAIAPFFQLFSVEPPLPVELLPRDWPVADARRSFERIGEVVAPPARAYLDRLIEEIAEAPCAAIAPRARGGRSDTV